VAYASKAWLNARNLSSGRKLVPGKGRLRALRPERGFSAAARRVRQRLL